MNQYGNVEIKRIEAGPFATNTYYVESGDEAIIIDPGADVETLMERLPQNLKHIAGIISTHGHFDHFLGASELKEKFGCPFMIGKGENDIMEWSYSVSLKYAGMELKRINADRFLEEGDVISFGETTARIISLPGHTEHSIGLIIGDTFLTGDTLFKGTIGRTDFGGSMELMEKSLQRILTFEQELKVMPGHGPLSTLREEFATNPFLVDIREED